MLVDLGYSEDKYRNAIANMEEIRKKIIAMQEDDGPITAKQIERKAGTQLNMASLIIYLTNAYIPVPAPVKYQ